MKVLRTSEVDRNGYHLPKISVDVEGISLEKFAQKKAERLSQYFGPTSTYEKQPFEKGIK